MDKAQVLDELKGQLEELKRSGLFKEERIIISQQQAQIRVAYSTQVLNLCANNYLGLANDPELIAAAKRGLDQYGFGMASVRFICGTLDVHRQLEQKLAQRLGRSNSV